MANSPRLTLPYISTGQAQKEITHNDALNKLEMMVMPRILDRHLSTPPGSPAEGDCYIIAAGGTGAWSGHDGKLAAWYSGWTIIAPQSGWRVYVLDENHILHFNGTIWTSPVLRAGSGFASGSPCIVGCDGSATNIDLQLKPDGTGRIDLSLNAANLVTTVGAAGAGSALPATPVGYIRIKVNGTAYKLPYYNE